jgi:hypothetical protein
MSEEQSGDAMLEEAQAKIAAAFDDGDVEFDEQEETSEIEDVSDDDVEEETVEEEVDDQEEIDPHEQAEMERARAQGWRPEEEYKGPPGKWKDYKEFNAVGDRIASKLNNKIDRLEDSNRKQQDMIKQLIKAQGQVAKQAQEEALAKLRAQKREAIELGDADAVEDLEEKIDQVKSTKAIEVEEEKPEAKPVDPEVADFVESEAAWFNESNPDMVRYAVSMENMERQLNPKASSADVMERVKSAVVQRFPGRVPGASAPKAKPKAKARQLKHSAVEGGTVTVPKGGARKLADLPPEAQKIAKQFERDGFPIDEYIKSYNEGM